MNTGNGLPDAEDSQRSQKEQPVENDCSHAIIAAAVEVLGVGLLESAYAAALAIELGERGLGFQREVAISGKYKGRDVGVVYKADFIVEGTVIVEIKAVDALADIHDQAMNPFLSSFCVFCAPFAFSASGCPLSRSTRQ